MSFKNLFIKHDLSPEVRAWLDKEIAEQEERFARLEQNMAELAPVREQWYQEFFDRITTLGFNVDGDDKMKISPADLPVKPAARIDRVVWKYGVDGE
jgi:hypothetical protein